MSLICPWISHLGPKASFRVLTGKLREGDFYPGGNFIWTRYAFSSKDRSFLQMRLRPNSLCPDVYQKTLIPPILYILIIYLEHSCLIHRQFQESSRSGLWRHMLKTCRRLRRLCRKHSNNVAKYDKLQLSQPFRLATKIWHYVLTFIHLEVARHPGQDMHFQLDYFCSVVTYNIILLSSGIL